MKRSFLSLVLIAASTFPVCGAEPEAPREWIPAPFHTIDYKALARDPMISASVTATLINGARPTDSNQIAAGEILSQFLEPIIKEMRSKLKVGGIAMSQPGKGRALISGVDVASGDRLVVPVPADTGKRVLGVANTFGLPVEYVTLDNGSIGLVILISEVRPNEVILRLPRFSPPLCSLAYDPGLSPSPRLLEPVLAPAR